VTAGPGSATTAFAYSEVSQTSSIVRVERADGAATFQAFAPFGPPALHFMRSATNARGDSAVLAKIGFDRLMLLTATRGGPLGTLAVLATSSETVAVDLDDDGRLVVAYYEFTAPQGVRAIFGRVHGPLGPVSQLSTGPSFSDVGAAIDDAGTATVAFSRADLNHRGRPAELVVRRAVRDGRFGPPRVIARGGPPIMGAGFASLRLAAAGRTTALAFDANDGDGRLGIAIARGGGRFGPTQRPTAPRLGSFVRQPFNPAVAVDRAGDVLLAYNLGIYGSTVHVTERRSGSDRFTRPRVVSKLGGGGAPAPMLLSDRTRLVAFDDSGGRLHAVTRLGSTRPDLTAPRALVQLLPGTEAGLRATNTFGVRIGCSEACLVSVRATLRTPTGRTIRGEQGIVLRAGASSVRRFAFDPAKRAGQARDGSILRVTVDAENASGASTERVAQLLLR